MWLHKLGKQKMFLLCNSTQTLIRVTPTMNLLPVALHSVEARISQEHVVLSFVRSAGSRAHRECPTERINGLENVLRVLLTLWRSLVPVSQHFIKTLNYFLSQLCRDGGWAFTTFHTLLWLILPTYCHSCFLLLVASQQTDGLNQSPSNSQLSNSDSHLEITPQLAFCTREGFFLIRWAGLGRWI